MSLPASGQGAQERFARVFGSLITQRFTGVMRLVDAGRGYAIYWQDGAIVDAESSAPEDQIGRVAMAAGLVDQGAVSDSIRRLAQQPGRTQKDILVEMGALKPEAVEHLARLLLTQRTLRVFSLPGASFTVNAQDHGRDDGGPVEARWTLYRGLKEYYDERRLYADLADLADKAIRLAPDAKNVLDLFGFTDEERILTTYLDKGYWELHDLLDACLTMPRNIVLAGVAALRAVDALDVQPADKVNRLRKRARETTVQIGRDSMDIAPFGAGTEPPVASNGPAPSRLPSARPQSATLPPSLSQQSFSPRPSGTAPPLPKSSAPHPALPSGQQRKITGSSSSLATATPGAGIAAAIRDQIVAKLGQIESHANHFEILEIDQRASSAQIREAYFALAKTYHPDSLAKVKLEVLKPQVHRIFVRITDAYAVISDDKRRHEYLQVLAQGGEHVLKRKEDDDEARASRIITAEDHFRKGEMALRRQMWSSAIEEFQTAIDLHEGEADHHAMLAWSKWCAATDKAGAFPEVRKGLTRALEINNACLAALYYLGQVYSSRGELDKAYIYFQKVLAINEHHVDAKREVRLIDMRGGPKSGAKGGGSKGGGSKGGGGGGLFDFLRRK